MFKSLIKSMTPEYVLSIYRQSAQRSRKRRFERDRVKLIDEMFSDCVPVTGISVPPRVILIAPGDPGTVFGSLGDDAMLTSIVTQARKRNSTVRIVIITANESASSLVRDHGFEAIEIWGRQNYVKLLRSEVLTNGVDAVVVIGADVMDGSYSEEFSLRMLVTANVACKLGVPTSVVGFSFNLNANPRLSEVYSRLENGIKFYVRDEISLKRFERFTRTRGILVADSAFCLDPDQGEEELYSWVNSKRASGKIVLGVNIHPMLFKREEHRRKSVDNLTEVLFRLSNLRNVAFVFMPHDHRDVFGDHISLDPIYQSLVKFGVSDVFYAKGATSSRIKAMVGCLDAVITGRMHLSIASLGMGVPVFCFSYHGKFEGLLRHFSLPLWLAPEATILLERDELLTEVVRFVDQHPELRQIVISAWPAVKKASERNYEVFDGVRSG